MQLAKRSPDDIWRAFRECILWAQADEDAVRRVFDQSVVSFYGTNEVILEPGESSRFAVVISGEIIAVHTNAQRKDLVLAHAGPGHELGGVSAVASAPLNDTFIASRPSWVALVPNTALHELLRNDPSSAYAAAREFSERFVRLLDKVQLVHGEVHSRLAGYICRRLPGLPDVIPRPAVIDLGMPRTQLAMELGTVPETLSRAFAKLRDDGLIAADGGRMISVLDPVGLHAIAQ
jgi:CRP/FNR family transcriptional regulator